MWQSGALVHSALLWPPCGTVITDHICGTCLYRIASPAKRLLVGCCTAVILTTFYAYHVHYLTFVTFSYSYNMKVNVTAGAVSFGFDSHSDLGVSRCWRPDTHLDKIATGQIHFCTFISVCNIILVSILIARSESESAIVKSKFKSESTVLESETTKSLTSLFQSTEHANDWHVY